MLWASIEEHKKCLEMYLNIFRNEQNSQKHFTLHIHDVHECIHILYRLHRLYINSDICKLYWWLAPRPVVTHESFVHCQLFCKGNWILLPAAYCCMALGCADCVGHKTRKYQKNTAINTVDTQHAADLFAFFYYLFYYVFIFIVFFCCSTFISLPISVSLTLTVSLSFSLRKSFRLHFRQ